VHAQTSSLRTREHIDVARLSGASTFSIIARDLLPYVLSYICMAFVLQVSGAILNEAALAMLGLGPSDSVSLGNMLHWAITWEAVRSAKWWVIIPPAVLLTLIAFALMMLQSSLDEVFNPRLRKGRTRRGSRKAAAAAAAVAAVPGSAVAATAVMEEEMAPGEKEGSS
jgi:peptide/nickel transport system permease protein